MRHSCYRLCLRRNIWTCFKLNVLHIKTNTNTHRPADTFEKFILTWSCNMTVIYWISSCSTMTSNSPWPTLEPKGHLIQQKYLTVHFQHKQVVCSQDEQSFVSGPESKYGVIGVQVGYLLFGNLPDLPTLLPVEEHRVDRRGLAVNEHTPEALTKSSVGEVGCTGCKLFIAFWSLNITWTETRIKTFCIWRTGCKTLSQSLRPCPHEYVFI